MSCDRLRLRLHALEVRGLPDVRGLRVPGEGVAGGGVERLPAVVAVEDALVAAGEHVLVDRGIDDLLDLDRVRPDVLQEDVVAGLVLAQGVGVEVEVHGTGQGVGDDQRRGGQVVHLHVRVDPAFEVAVAGEHGGDGKVVGLDGLGDLGVQRAGVADAGGAAVADDVEAELLQVRGQARLLVVVGDDLGTGGHGGLDPRLGRQALVDGVAGQQCGGQHHGRVGRVGAGRDRGDRHRAVVQLELAAVCGLDVDRVGRAAVGPSRPMRVRRSASRQVRAPRR